VLEALNIASSSWYRQGKLSEDRRRPGPAPRAMPPAVEGWVLAMAKANPWYGYKRIAATPVSRLDQLLPDRGAATVR
jgi:hypothetical protein